MAQRDLEPPSYEDSVHQQDTNQTEITNPATILPSSNIYISSRPAPAPHPSDTITYKLDVMSPNFPTPEGAWLNRDVQQRDWDTFVGQLHRPAAEKETEAQRRRRIDYVISEWNDEFFAPRGCRIEAQAGPSLQIQTEQAAGETAAGRSKTKGWGIDIGNSFIGIALPPDSGGFGLRIGGGLLGVKWSQDPKPEAKSDAKPDAPDSK
jgi:hypothetical protein